MPSAAERLDALFEADRALRAHERALLAQPEATLTDLFTAAVAEACALEDRDEAVMRLERLVDLCAQVPGPAMVDALIRILDDAAQSVRVQAMDALVEVGFERYAEVARGVERALAQGDGRRALSELPWVVAEIAEPSARGLIARFLSHQDAGIAAAAVEALATLGDPAAVADLQPLADDPRPIPVEDLDDDTSATLGELAREAIGSLK